jgi:hypothetical protein
MTSTTRVEITATVRITGLDPVLWRSRMAPTPTSVKMTSATALPTEAIVDRSKEHGHGDDLDHRDHHAGGAHLSAGRSIVVGRAGTFS